MNTWHSLKSALGQLTRLADELPKSIKQLQETLVNDWIGQVVKSDAPTQDAVGRLLGWAVEHRGPSLSAESKREFDELFEKVPQESRRYAGDFLDIMIRSDEYNVFVRNMSLVYIVTLYENYVQSVLEISFNNWPSSLGKDKSISFEQLNKCRDISEARRLVVSRAASEIMHEGIEDVDVFIEKRWGVKMSSSPEWIDFVERFYRRNIIIHNNGMPNDIYKSRTGYTGPDERLDVSSDYLKATIELFGKTGERLFNEFNAKLKAQ